MTDKHEARECAPANARTAEQIDAPTTADLLRDTMRERLDREFRRALEWRKEWQR